MTSSAETVRELLLEENPEALYCDGYDAAIVGVARRCGQPTLVVYSSSKFIRLLMSEGLPPEEAAEYFEFNVVGAWVGPNTPIFWYST
jgi:hypothetical protein